MQKKNIRHLEIILKISERCNINCTYCYVFNMGNSLSMNSKAIIQLKNIIALRNFFERSTTEYEIGTIQVDFHGGEPLMMNKQRFVEMCHTLTQGNYKNANLVLALQTNGILIDDEWINIFAKFRVYVSVSIDGPKHINDRFRIDQHGKGTYERTVNGLKKLQKAWEMNLLPGEPGILSVANSAINGAEVYHHFSKVLKCKRFDFLIPDNHYSSNQTNDIGKFLNEALDAWFNDSKNNVFIRIFNTYIGTMLHGDFNRVLGMSKHVESVYALTVTSDGFLRIDDTLRSSSHKIFDSIGHVNDLSLSQVLNSENFREYNELNETLPKSCGACIWMDVCNGGRLINRFSLENGFKNKTVHCQSMRIFLSRGATHLIASGVNPKTILKNIQNGKIKNETFKNN